MPQRKADDALDGVWKFPSFRRHSQSQWSTILNIPLCYAKAKRKVQSSPKPSPTCAEAGSLLRFFTPHKFLQTDHGHLIRMHTPGACNIQLIQKVSLTWWYTNNKIMSIFSSSFVIAVKKKKKHPPFPMLSYLTNSADNIHMWGGWGQQHTRLPRIMPS